MEFLNINLTKNVSLLLDAIQFLLLPDFKPYSSLVLKIFTEKSAKQENSSLFILYNGKIRVEN
jgi:hypothetical protein